MDLMLIFLILVTHYVFDWKLQTRYMAENKSTSNKALGIHVGVYTIGMLLVSVCSPLSVGWAIFNGLAHFGVDYISSRLTSKHYKSEKYKKFWDTIGADQLIHYIILFLSAAINLNIPL